MSESINHNGVVEKIEGNSVFVRIIQQSACSGCHAQSMCTASEKKDKIIEVSDFTQQFNVNDKVMVCGKTSLGLQAVFLAFVLPLLIILAAIIIGTCLRWTETASGLMGLLFLLPYYYMLYLLRDKLKKKFVFTLKKLN